MNVLVIHNLRSGFGDGAIYDFIRNYSENGDSVTIRTFDGPTSIPGLVADANQFDFVVVSGGDGTVAAVAYALRYTGVPLLIFPAGTANLLALNLFMPEEPHALCKVADEALVMDLDLGEIITSEGTMGFAIMAGCGYDQKIMKDATASKALLGDLAYFHAAFANPLPQRSEFHLTIDGKQIHTHGIGVVIANVSKIQFDIMVADENQPRDGLFDVVVLKTENALELLPTLFAKVVDRSGALVKKIGALEIYRGREVTVDAEPAMYLEYDGEPTQIATPVTLRNLHNAARFIVPKECIDHFTAEPPSAE